MQWQPPLVIGRLQRRYKRFLADVVLDDGLEVTVHCPNTGAMTGCAEPGSVVWLSPSTNPKRKLPYTWELVETQDGHRICIHSALANGLVAEALDAGEIDELAQYKHWRGEWKLPSGSRIDFVLSDQAGDAEWDCYVEVKSVTLHRGGGQGAFPDAVSDRARRHVDELLALKRGGARVLLIFAVLHEGIDRVGPAADIDPRYAETLAAACADGLEVLALGAEVSPQGMRLTRRLAFTL
ncbi:DNA/RNA nuclease SfsA [Spongiibacter taiwanensis]|uniref:DNA/RNA nuclease SfsA n=1 Tax=Spongiibacter taiwanensis TaxID=1748242 RepID=UPI0020356449|nr:DNA/RNA nuclease SfsA [Spongiibacter taiwanensis]USA44406.1 DNA/RNA nuclease SfsA [Spongiibacter taiwanensis]